MKEQILSYVHFVATGSGGEQVDPQVASTASNTGDPTLTIIACLLALIAAIAGVIYFKKYRPSVRPNFAGAHSSSNQNSSFSAAKHMRSGATNHAVRPSVKDIHRGSAAKLSLVVFVVIAALAAVCAFASVQQNAMHVANAQNSAGSQNVVADTQAANKINSDSQSITVEPIVGTVDRDSQAISFAPSSVTNNTERDIYVDAASLIKRAGIQDDDCTWTLKIDGTVVFEGKATQEDSSNSTANASSICIKAGTTDDVELSQTGLTYQTALGLADKDALKMSFDVSSFKTSTKMNDPEHGSITSNIPDYVSSKATYQVKDGVLCVDQDEQFSAKFETTSGYNVDYWTSNGTTIIESTPAAIDSDIEFIIYTKAVQVWDVKAEADNGKVDPASVSVNDNTGYTISDDNKTITFDDGQKITYTDTPGWFIKNWKIGESVAKQTGFIVADTTFTAEEAQELEFSVKVSVDNKDRGSVNSGESVSYTFKEGSKYKVDGESITFTNPDSTTEKATFTRNTGWQLKQWNLKDETEPLPSEETEITDNMDIVATTEMKTFEVKVEAANSSSGDISFSSGEGPVVVQENSEYSIPQETPNAIKFTNSDGSEVTATFNVATSTIHGYSFDKWTKSATTNENKITENTTFKALANEAYACYYENASEAENIQAKTLYFYYDSERATRTAAGNRCYDMNTASKAPEWNTSASSFEHAVVADNFHNFNTYACRQWFDSMSNLKEAPQGCEYINTENCTSMKQMFSQCCSANTTLTGVPNVATWNVKKVTDFSSIFAQYGMQSTKLDAVPDVSQWETDATIKTLACAFQSYGRGGTTASPQSCILSKVPDVSNWNMSGVNNISSMFNSYGQYSTALNEVPNVANWDTSSVIDASAMFMNYAKGDKDTSIKTIINKVPDVSKWNTSSMGFLSKMFEAYGAESTALSATPDVLTKEVGEGTAKYTAWDLSSAEETARFFSYYGSAASSNSIELKLNWDLGSAYSLRDVSQMFMDSGFKTIVCDKDWSNLSSEIVSEKMFKDCSNLVGGNGTTYDGEVTNIARAKPDKGTHAGPGYFTPTTTTYTLDVNQDETYTTCNDIKWLDSTGKEITPETGKTNPTISAAYGAESGKVKPVLNYKDGMEITSIKDDNDIVYTLDENGYITIPWKADLIIKCNTELVIQPYASFTPTSSSDSNTDPGDLIFYYNNQLSVQQKMGNNTFIVDLEKGGQAWSAVASQVKHLSFDASFDDTEGKCRPKNCDDWFSNFTSVTSIAQADLLHLNTTSCTSMKSMFKNCEAASKIEASALPCNGVTDMSCMFFGCKNASSISVNSSSTVAVENMTSMFEGCEKVSGFPTAWALATGEVKNMSRMFYGCIALTSLNLSNWTDVSKVENTENMFYGCTKLQSVYLTSWITSALTNAKSMFMNCTSLLTLTWPNFKTGQNAYLSQMFYNAFHENGVNLDLSSWDTSNVVNMTKMFYESPYIKTLNLQGWNIKKVTDTESMFEVGTTATMSPALTEINIVGWEPTSLQNAYKMFSGLKALTKIYCNGNWTASSGQAPKLSVSVDMFKGCEKLPDFNKNKVDKTYAYPNTGTAGYFTGMSATIALTGDHVTWKDSTGTSTITSITGNVGETVTVMPVVSEYSYGIKNAVDNLGNTYTIKDDGCVDIKVLSDISPVTANVNTAYACYYTKAATIGTETRNANDFIFYYDDKVSTREDAGGKCFTLNYYSSSTSTYEGAQPGWASSSESIPANAKYVDFDESFSSFKTEVCAYWFANFSNSNLKKINNLGRIDTSECKCMSAMFAIATGLTELDVSVLKTETVVRMDGMFKYLELTKIDGLTSDNFNTENVEYMGSMFQRCKNLTSLDVTHFNTAKVKKMQGMFQSVLGLTTLDLHSFSIASLDNTSSMFVDNAQLTTIIWDADVSASSKVTEHANMFNGCTKLHGPKNTYIESDVGKTLARVDGGTSRPGVFTPSS